MEFREVSDGGCDIIRPLPSRSKLVSLELIVDILS
jgi:hypothetical protein